MAEYRLTSEIIKLSRSKTWSGAKIEWKLILVYRVEEFQPCLCGHTPIRELWLIENRKTRHKATVGSRCVRKFLSMDSDKQFAAFKRVNSDINRSFDADTIHSANQREWIDGYDMNFYLSIIRKRHVDQDRSKWKRSINKTIIAKLLQ